MDLAGDKGSGITTKGLNGGLHLDVPVLFVGDRVHETKHVELADGRQTETNAFSVRFMLRSKHRSEDKPEPSHIFISF